MKKQKLKQMLAALLVLLMLPGMTACAGSEGRTGSDGSMVSDIGTEAGTIDEAAALPSAEAEESPAQVENLVIGTTTANDTFNLLTQSGAYGKTNYNCLANGDFVYLNAKNELTPYFLKSFEISEDGCVLYITFPTDAVWHDGEPVTAEDVQFTFAYKRDVMNASTLKNLTDIEVTGEDSMTLTFSQPDAYAFLAQGAGNNNCVIPKHIWETITEYEEYTGGDASIGCGPYKLVSYDLDAGTSYYEAVPENAYLGDLTVESVTVKSYSGQDALLMAMANGEVDVMFDYATPIDVTLLDLISDHEDIALGDSDYSGNYQLTFGMERAPGNDRSFREAAVKGLNWELLCQVINGGYGQIPGSGIIPPSCLGYDDSLWKFYRDLDEAKSLLDSAGYADTDGDGYRENPDGSALEVKVTPQNASKKQELLNRIADVIMSSLDEMGIKAYIDQESLQSSEKWEATVIDGDYDLFIGYTTSGMAKYSSAFRYFVADSRDGDESNTWIWGTYHDQAFTDLVWSLTYSASEQDYRDSIAGLQKAASEELFGCALCWETCFYPYRTDKYQGFENWAGWGVVNPEIFYTLTSK
ncbi:MAG: ABC transporter substrate-binding protein [Lachnospiraceae bacterium]